MHRVTGFRSHKDGSHYPIRRGTRSDTSYRQRADPWTKRRMEISSPDMSMRQSLFFKPKYKEASENISISSPSAAEFSIRYLNNEWKPASRSDKKNRLMKFAVLAANRADAMSRNPNISDRERIEARQVARIYRSWVNSHKASGA